MLYLRDVVAAGPHATAAIVADVEHILRFDPIAQHVVGAAVSYVEFIVAGAYAAEDVHRTTIMLVERELGRSPAGTRQDIDGHLTDLLEILRPFRSSNPPDSVNDAE